MGSFVWKKLLTIQKLQRQVKYTMWSDNDQLGTQWDPLPLHSPVPVQIFYLTDNLELKRRSFIKSNVE